MDLLHPVLDGKKCSADILASRLVTKFLKPTVNLQVELHTAEESLVKSSHELAMIFF